MTDKQVAEQMLSEEEMRLRSWEIEFQKAHIVEKYLSLKKLIQPDMWKESILNNMRTIRTIEQNIAQAKEFISFLEVESKKELVDKKDID